MWSFSWGISCLWSQVFLARFVEKTIILSLNYFCTFMKGWLAYMYVWVYFCVLYSVRLICVAITWPIPHHVDFWAAVLSHSVVYDSLLCDPMDYHPPCSSVHGDSPGKNAGVGSHALLQGIFLTQRSKPGLSHCRWILYWLSLQGRRVIRVAMY